MLEKTKNFLYESKSKIGLVHAALACIGAVLLSYLTTMLLSSIIIGDFALKIIPSMILTPILMSFYGIWILFSRTRILAIKKICFTFVLLVVSLIFSIKVF